MATGSCLCVSLLLLVAFQSATMIMANYVLPSPRCSPVPGSTKEKFQFALNFHFYKAELFLRSSVGCGINDISPGLVKGPAPIGATLANLDKRTRKFIEESGLASAGHTRDIANILLLKTPLPMPQLDLAAGVALYKGASYGVLRSLLNDRANLTVPPYTSTVESFTNLAAQIINQLGGCGVKDEGLIVPLPLGAEGQTKNNVILADVNSLVYARTEREMLRNIFRTGNATKPGGVFPCGFKGALYRRILARNQS
ncbi:hypothetical protein V6N13_045343 [Hibiscus sabdariffa]|uniref:Desiccation-related protein PCC13-62 n=1 Tax=Hibiscus sabdariffa TaxID=183260 RepID=A0ABR2RKS6_9ROSI